MKTFFYLIVFMQLISVNLKAQWSVEHLSQTRLLSGAIGYQDKVYVAGGEYYVGSTSMGMSNRVDIYDNATGIWSIDSLFSPRREVAVCAVNNRIYFAGGRNTFGSGVKEIDIYDVISGTWIVDSLISEQSACTPLIIGNKIYFAGGGGVQISIYDYTTQVWTQDTLPTERLSGGAAVVGNKAAYGGGFAWINGNYVTLKSVDIFNSTTNSWDTASLSIARSSMGTIAAGGKIFFAGGVNLMGGFFSNVVDIYDVNTNSWSTDTLSQARCNIATASIGDLVFFAGGNSGWSVTTPSKVIDIYNLSNNTWTTDSLSLPRNYFASAQLNNKVFFAGGATDANNSCTDVVNIYTDFTADVKENIINNKSFRVFPNPSNGIIQITFPLISKANIKIDVLNFQGEVISTISDMVFGKGENKITYDTQNLNRGMYLIRLSNKKDILLAKFIKL